MPIVTAMVVSQPARRQRSPPLRTPSEPQPVRTPHLWRDLFALAGGQLLSKVLGFAAFAYLARVLAPHAYGAIEYAAGLAFIGGMFIDAGLSPIGVRRIARDPLSAESVSADVLGARAVLAVASAALLAACAPLVAPDPLTQRLVVLFAFSLLAVPWAQMWLFQAMHRIGWTAAIQTVRMAVFLGVVVLFVHDSGHALRVGAAEFAGLALSGACALALQRRYIAPVHLRFGIRRLTAQLAESLPIALANLVGIVTAFAPLLLAVNLLGAAAAAYFAAAHRLYFALNTFAWIYHFNLFPVVAQAQARATPRLRELVTASLRLVSWAGAAAALALTLVAKPLLGAMFGAPFAAAGGAFVLLVWSLPIKLLADHCTWLLIADGGERAVTAVRLLGLALALVLGVPLVYAWGPAGGAAALLVAAIASWGGLHLAARRRLGWMPWTPAVPAIACSLSLLFARRALGLGVLEAAAMTALAFAAAALLGARRLAADYRLLAAAKTQRAGEEPL